MKSIMYLLYDILNNSTINFENIIAFCKLKQYFSMDKLQIPPFKPFIQKHLLIHLLDKNIKLNELDLETRDDIFNLLIDKVEKVYYPYSENMKYCIEIKNILNITE